MRDEAEELWESASERYDLPPPAKSALREAVGRGYLVTPADMQRYTADKVAAAWVGHCRGLGRPAVWAILNRARGLISLAMAPGTRLADAGLRELGTMLRGASLHGDVACSGSGGEAWVRARDAEVLVAQLLDLALEWVEPLGQE
jgi:hypothetical protein